MKPSISEILEHCSKLPSTKERVEFLQQQQSDTLCGILKYALDPRVEWLLPKGVPPYKPTEHLDQHGSLYHNIRKINIFVRGGTYPDMHPIKREALFIQFIEGIDPKDAKLLCSVKDKKIPYKGITASLVNSAFPGLIQEKEKSVK